MSAASEKRDEPDGWWLVVGGSIVNEIGRSLHYYFFYNTLFLHDTCVGTKPEATPNHPKPNDGFISYFQG